MAFAHINVLAFLFKGDVDGGRKSILEGIKLREELGVQLYVAAGNCDLGRKKLRPSSDVVLLPCRTKFKD